MAQTRTKRGVSGSTIAIIVLSILLLASVAIGITLAYFTQTVNVTGNITLGDPIKIQITQGGASVSALTFSSDAMPGTTYDQAIGISAPANTSEALVRAKLTITDTEGQTTPVVATTTNTWQKGADDYYYYKGTMTAGGTADFVTAVTIPTSLTNDDANKTYTVDVVVEAIQLANNAANAVWTTAPTDWLNTYSPEPTPST